MEFSSKKKKKGRDIFNYNLERILVTDGDSGPLRKTIRPHYFVDKFLFHQTSK